MSVVINGSAGVVTPAIFPSIPVTVTTTPYTVLEAKNSFIFAGTGTITVTLPDPASYSGQLMFFKTTAAQAVNSASANVAPVGSASLGTAILAATAGKWAIMQSNGTSWVIMASN
jgi:hypothetical protein